MRTLICLAIALACGAGPVLAVQHKEGSPEAAIVALYRALYAGDLPAFERLTMPHPQRSRLTTGARRNEIGFVVQRAGAEWRVEAEPYFVLLNR